MKGAVGLSAPQFYPDELMRLNAARQSNQTMKTSVNQSEKSKQFSGAFGGLSSYQFGQAGHLASATPSA